MNPEISELFGLIDMHNKDNPECESRTCQAVKNALELIKQISVTLNPKIPEPWASMTADEIIKGVGVYR